MPWSRFFKHSSQTPALRLACFIGIAMLACGCSFENLTRVTPGSFATPQDCGECHVDITREWTSSPHARAYTNPRYRQATDDYHFTQCIPCHAPLPTLTTDTPQARADSRELGVSCVSCHLKDGAMVGPQQPTGMVKPHPITVDPKAFEGAQMCGRCHRGTKSQWAASTIPDKHDCRHCHMPEVTRTITKATSEISRLFVAMEKAAAEHRHSFDLAPTIAADQAIILDIVTHPGLANVTLTNRLPHNLPTGDFGVRIVTVELSAIDAAGGALILDSHEFTSAGGAVVPSGESMHWSVTIPANAASLRAVAYRQGRDGADRVSLTQRQVAITPTAQTQPEKGAATHP